MKRQSPQSANPQSSIADAYDAWLLDLQARRCTPATVDHYRQFLAPFVRWLQESHGLQTLAELKPTHLRRFLTDLQTRNLSGYTVLGYYRDARAWLNFCVAEGWLSASPAAKVRPPKVDKPLLPAFDDMAVHRLLNACNSARDRAVVLFLLDTGVRARELLSLRGGDLDMRDGAVTVRVGKGGKGRVVYIGAQTRRAMLRYFAEVGKPGDGAPLWPSLHGGQLTTSGLRQWLARIGRRAGVERVHPHRFRRTFALWNLRAGMNIYALQRLMGHEDLTVLRRYLALVQEDLQQAHAQAAVVDTMLGGKARGPPGP